MGSMVLAQATSLANALKIDSTEPAKLVEVLKATAFRGQVSDHQLVALLIVASQYGLSPWTKEIYAFPDKNNGIVPVVGVDGWSRIINSNPQFDGMEFSEADDGSWIECAIFRKDRSHAIKVKEYMAECRRDAGPWKSHPRRMLRHKAMIQCARLAFGFVGIYDPDEAERIIDADVIEVIPAAQIEDKRKQRHDEAVEQYQTGIDAIKDAIEREDYSYMTQCWDEIPQAAQMDLWLATTKGGIFSTHERKCIKERIVRESQSEAA